MGAEVILHPNMTDTIDRDVELAISRATAATNQVYCFDINGSGDAGSGRSIIVDPSGYVLHQAGNGAEVMPIEVDFAKLRRERERGLRSNLGQPLKSFRDRDVDFAGLPARQRRRRLFTHVGALDQTDPLIHFKRVNDQYGHHAGDQMLCKVADVLTGLIRADDFVARTGGEEFLVACVAVNAETACLLAERLRAGVAELRIRVAGQTGAMQCTVSIGVSQPFSQLRQWEQAARAADQALYAAKAAGRDRVTLEPEPEPG
jgi:diguanylate cyclase (GGDEF)-like protein